jgi:hypothetical protein
MSEERTGLDSALLLPRLSIGEAASASLSLALHDQPMGVRITRDGAPDQTVAVCIPVEVYQLLHHLSSKVSGDSLGRLIDPDYDAEKPEPDDVPAHKLFRAI